MKNRGEERRDFIKKFGMFMAGGAVSLNLMRNWAFAEDRRPNILFIMTDDHAYQAISAYENHLIQTPNIDRIAQEGAVFNNFFCTNSICAPSRAVLLTGKFSHKNGLVQNDIPFDTSQNTFVRELKEEGYATSLFGKWHLRSEPVDFDYYSVLPGQGDYYQPDFKIQGRLERKNGYVTDLITDQALEWLDHREDGGPFCMLVHHKAPHRNWQPSLKHLGKYDDMEFPLPENLFDSFKGKSQSVKYQEMSILRDMSLHYDLKVDSVRKEDLTPLGDDYKTWAAPCYERMTPVQRRRFKAAYEKRNEDYLRNHYQGDELLKWKYQCYMRDYLSCIASVDENIGRVLDYLEEKGLKENTIVVYTSDQGFYLGEHGWFDKRFMYEESLRTPLLMMYPKEIKKKTKIDKMAQNVDFAPTFLDYAGLKKPGDMQGESFRKLLIDEDNTPWRDAVYYHYYEYPGMHNARRHYGIRTERYKLIHFYYDLDEWEFYDLQNDPREMNNLYGKKEYEGTVENLKKKLDRLRMKYDDLEEEKFLPVNSEKIAHLAVGGAARYHFPYSSKYDGGGKAALIDGIKGPSDMRLMKTFEAWQGYEAEDLDVTIELPREERIRSIEAGFLNSAKDWVFPPQWVEFSWKDEKGKERQVRVDRKKKLEKNAYERAPFKISINDQKIKKVRIRAKNEDICPQWHPGSGEKAWMFIDEVIFL